MTIKEIFSKIKNIFIREADSEMLSVSDLKPEYNVNRQQIKNIRYVFNPNIYIKTELGYFIDCPDRYREIYRSNYQFRSALDQRIRRVNSLDIEFQEAFEKYNSNKKLKVKRINRYIKKQLERIAGYNHRTGLLEGFNNTIEQLCDAFIVGKSILQIIYKTDQDGNYDLESGYFEVEELQFCNSDYFDFLSDTNELVYIDEYGSYEILNPFQFLVFANKGNYVNPHGLSEIGESGFDLHVRLLQLWDKYDEYSERNAYNSYEVVAKGYENKLTGVRESPDYRLVENAIEMAKEISNGCAIGHSDDIEVKQIPNSNNNFNFTNSIELIERAITKQILGNTTALQNSETYSTQGVGSIHEQATDAIIEDSAKNIQQVLNELIVKLLKLNGLYDEDIELPKINIKYQEDVLNLNELEYALKLVDKGAPVNIYELMKKANLSVPNGFDETLTFNNLNLRSNNDDEQEAIN